ncbi:MAG: TIGR04084 family radical SAM/SPASM domain-containing protein [Candidatus Thorarchaeota archaeon]|nr:TIGR04084 family radical SAM/SPASM domain-containing protein [Candidatus Thorarchaeota archaeon]
MNYHIVLTRRCNLNCVYCHGGEETGPETEIQYTIDELASFIEQDEDPQLMFYGGEPLLRIEKMIEMMDRFPNARFMLQTNGLLLSKIPKKYVKKFHSILVSIDGPKSITDGYRSEGVYQKVIDNLCWLEESGFAGDIVARMAISQESDIYRDVRHLLDLGHPSFKHVHWQLNVVWDAEGNWQDFDTWVSESYLPGISRLVEDWLIQMRKGRIEGIVPFAPLMYSLLTGKGAELRCGSGLDTFAIHVDGKIGICPISPDWEFSIMGDLQSTKPNELRNIMKVEEPCPSCEAYDICGGRCLFANKQRLWGEEGFDKVCQTVKHLIKELRLILPEVSSIIAKGILSLDGFEYPEYNNGCEIIP